MPTITSTVVQQLLTDLDHIRKGYIHGATLCAIPTVATALAHRVNTVLSARQDWNTTNRIASRLNREMVTVILKQLPNEEVREALRCATMHLN